LQTNLKMVHILYKYRKQDILLILPSRNPNRFLKFFHNDNLYGSNIRKIKPHTDQIPFSGDDVLSKINYYFDKFEVDRLPSIIDKDFNKYEDIAATLSLLIYLKPVIIHMFISSPDLSFDRISMLIGQTRLNLFIEILKLENYDKENYSLNILKNIQTSCTNESSEEVVFELKKLINNLPYTNSIVCGDVSKNYHKMGSSMRHLLSEMVDRAGYMLHLSIGNNKGLVTSILQTKNTSQYIESFDKYDIEYYINNILSLLSEPTFTFKNIDVYVDYFTAMHIQMKENLGHLFTDDTMLDRTTYYKIFKYHKDNPRSETWICKSNCYKYIKNSFVDDLGNLYMTFDHICESIPAAVFSKLYSSDKYKYRYIEWQGKSNKYILIHSSDREDSKLTYNDGVLTPFGIKCLYLYHFMNIELSKMSKELNNIKVDDLNLTSSARNKLLRRTIKHARNFLEMMLNRYSMLFNTEAGMSTVLFDVRFLCILYSLDRNERMQTHIDRLNQKRIEKNIYHTYMVNFRDKYTGIFTGVYNELIMQWLWSFSSNTISDSKSKINEKSVNYIKNLIFYMPRATALGLLHTYVVKMLMYCMYMESYISVLANIHVYVCYILSHHKKNIAHSVLNDYYSGQDLNDVRCEQLELPQEEALYICNILTSIYNLYTDTNDDIEVLCSINDFILSSDSTSIPRDYILNSKHILRQSNKIHNCILMLHKYRTYISTNDSLLVYILNAGDNLKCLADLYYEYHIAHKIESSVQVQDTLDVEFISFKKKLIEVSSGCIFSSNLNMVTYIDSTEELKQECGNINNYSNKILNSFQICQIVEVTDTSDPHEKCLNAASTDISCDVLDEQTISSINLTNKLSYINNKLRLGFDFDYKYIITIEKISSRFINIFNLLSELVTTVDRNYINIFEVWAALKLVVEFIYTYTSLLEIYKSNVVEYSSNIYIDISGQLSSTLEDLRYFYKIFLNIDLGPENKLSNTYILLLKEVYSISIWAKPPSVLEYDASQYFIFIKYCEVTFGLFKLLDVLAENSKLIRTAVFVFNELMLPAFEDFRMTLKCELDIIDSIGLKLTSIKEIVANLYEQNEYNVYVGGEEWTTNIRNSYSESIFNSYDKFSSSIHSVDGLNIQRYIPWYLYSDDANDILAVGVGTNNLNLSTLNNKFDNLSYISKRYPKTNPRYYMYHNVTDTTYDAEFEYLDIIKSLNTKAQSENKLSTGNIKFVRLNKIFSSDLSTRISTDTLNRIPSVDAAIYKPNSTYDAYMRTHSHKRKSNIPNTYEVSDEQIKGLKTLKSTSVYIDPELCIFEVFLLVNHFLFMLYNQRTMVYTIYDKLYKLHQSGSSCNILNITVGPDKVPLRISQINSAVFDSVKFFMYSTCLSDHYINWSFIFDYRGRIYPKETYFDYQNTKLLRSIIRPAKEHFEYCSNYFEILATVFIQNFKKAYKMKSINYCVSEFTDNFNMYILEHEYGLGENVSNASAVLNIVYFLRKIIVFVYRDMLLHELRYKFSKLGLPDTTLNKFKNRLYELISISTLNGLDLINMQCDIETYIKSDLLYDYSYDYTCVFIKELVSMRCISVKQVDKYIHKNKIPFTYFLERDATCSVFQLMNLVGRTIELGTEENCQIVNNFAHVTLYIKFITTSLSLIDIRLDAYILLRDEIYKNMENIRNYNIIGDEQLLNDEVARLYFNFNSATKYLSNESSLIILYICKLNNEFIHDILDKFQNLRTYKFLVDETIMSYVEYSRYVNLVSGRNRQCVKDFEISDFYYHVFKTGCDALCTLHSNFVNDIVREVNTNIYKDTTELAIFKEDVLNLYSNNCKRYTSIDSLGRISSYSFLYSNIIVPYSLYKCYQEDKTSYHIKLYVTLYDDVTLEDIRYTFEIPIYAVYEHTYSIGTDHNYITSNKKGNTLLGILETLVKNFGRFKSDIGKGSNKCTENFSYEPLLEFHDVLLCDYKRMRRGVRTKNFKFKNHSIRLRSTEGLSTNKLLYSSGIYKILKCIETKSKFMKFHKNGFEEITHNLEDPRDLSSISTYTYYLCKTIKTLFGKSGKVSFVNIYKFKNINNTMYKVFYNNVASNAIDLTIVKFISTGYEDRHITEVEKIIHNIFTTEHISSINNDSSTQAYFNSMLRPGVKSSVMPGSYGAGNNKKYINIIENYRNKFKSDILSVLDIDAMVYYFADMTKLILQSSKILRSTDKLRKLDTECSVGATIYFGGMLYNRFSCISFKNITVLERTKRQMISRTSKTRKSTVAIIKNTIRSIDIPKTERGCTVNKIHSIDGHICVDVVNYINSLHDNIAGAVLCIHDAWLMPMYLYNDTGTAYNKALHKFFKGKNSILYDDVYTPIMYLALYRKISSSGSIVNIRAIRFAYTKVIKSIYNYNYTYKSIDDLDSSINVDTSYLLSSQISHLISHSYYEMYCDIQNTELLTFEQFMDKSDRNMFNIYYNRYSINNIDPMYILITFFKYNELYDTIISEKNYMIHDSQIFENMSKNIRTFMSGSIDENIISVNMLAYLTYDERMSDIFSIIAMYDSCELHNDKCLVVADTLRYIMKPGMLYSRKKTAIRYNKIEYYAGLQIYTTILKENPDIYKILYQLHIHGVVSETGVDYIFNVEDENSLPPHSTTSN